MVDQPVGQVVMVLSLCSASLILAGDILFSWALRLARAARDFPSPSVRGTPKGVFVCVVWFPMAPATASAA